MNIRDEHEVPPQQAWEEYAAACCWHDSGDWIVAYAPEMVR